VHFEIGVMMAILQIRLANAGNGYSVSRQVQVGELQHGASGNTWLVRYYPTAQEARQEAMKLEQTALDQITWQQFDGIK
jgi:hypothetical protein